MSKRVGLPLGFVLSILAILSGSQVLIAPPVSASSSPLSWSAPTQIDFGPEYAHANGMGKIACPTIALCVAGANGGVWTSTDPFTANHAVWSFTNLDLSVGPTPMSCPAANYCVGSDTDGNVWASTDPTAGSTAWTVTHIDAATSPGDELLGVSCALGSPTACVAIDHAGNLFNSTNATAASPTWTETATPAGVQALSAVSCASTSLCVATGGGTDGKGLIVYTTNPTASTPTWTVTDDVDSASGFILSIVCLPGAFCVAGDGAGDVDVSTSPTGDDSAWSTLSADPFGTLLVGMTCASATFCLATDSEGNIVYSTDPTTQWLTALDEGDFNEHSLGGAACPTSTDCIASDNRGAVMVSTDPTTKSSWTLVGVAGTNAIEGISCPSVSECFADDQGGNILASTNPMGGASAWTGANIDYGNSTYGGWQMIGGISRPSGSLCVTGDQNGDVCASADPTSTDSFDWSGCPDFVGDGLSASFMAGVSCASGASSSLCAATNGTDVYTSSTPTNISSWANEEVDASGTITGISCPTTTFCVAGTGDSIYWTDDPTDGASASWTETTGVGANHVSCPTATFCAAVDDAGGDAEFSTNPSGGSDAWTDTSSVDAATNLTHISCTSSSFCVAIDGQGNAFTSTDPTSGSASAWSEQSLGDPGNGPYELGCASSSGSDLCLVGDSVGNMVVGTAGASSENLSVSLAGAGAGTVTSDPEGISCPGACSDSFLQSTQVTLTATPASGSTFAGWSDAGCSGTGNCVVTMSAAAVVTATFVAALPLAYTPLTPTRICDTRTGNPSDLSGTAAQCNGTGNGGGDRLSDGVPLTIVATGEFDVPDDATAVVLNVTAIDASTQGYLTVYPAGQSVPTASNVNFTADTSVPNLVEVGVSNSGKVSLVSNTSVDVAVDLEGYVAPSATGEGLYNALAAPARICDTRAGNPSNLSGGALQCSGNDAGHPLTAGDAYPVQVTGVGGVPPVAQVSAVVLNVTVSNPAGKGYLSAYPAGPSAPTASNLNDAASQTVANRVVVPVSATGDVDLIADQDTNAIVDVSGWYSAAAGTGAGYSALAAPARICDTRAGNPSNLSGGALQCNETANADQPLGAAGTLTVQVTGLASVPAGVTAVVLNLTAISPSAQTYLSVYPGPSRPTISDLNPAAGSVRANLVVATLTPAGTISIYNNAGSVNLVVDVAGYYE